MITPTWAVIPPVWKAENEAVSWKVAAVESATESWAGKAPTMEASHATVKTTAHPSTEPTAHASVKPTAHASTETTAHTAVKTAATLSDSRHHYKATYQEELRKSSHDTHLQPQL
jgi:hypothetical protein